jgi:hypothetical protein
MRTGCAGTSQHFFWMFFFSKGIMVKGTVLRGVVDVEDKNEILFDPWLELKLVFLLIDSELKPNDLIQLS